MTGNNRPNLEDAIEKLAEYIQISEDAMIVAKAWDMLPPGIQHHVWMLLHDHLATRNPILNDLYANAQHQDQARFNRIVERVQDRKRGLPPASEK